MQCFSLIRWGDYEWNVVTGVSTGSINALYISTIDESDITKYENRFKTLWTSIKNKDIYELNLFFNKISLFSTVPLLSTIRNVFKNRIIKRKLMIGSANLS